MPYEDLRTTLAIATGRIVAVDTSLKLLERIGFFESGQDVSRMLFYSRSSAVRRTRRGLAKQGRQDVRVLRGSTSGLPLARRSVDVLIFPFPPVGKADLMPSLRRTVSVLVHDGVVVMHGPVRRNPLGWLVHVGSIIGRKAGGIPSELEVTAWTLRAGFNRIVRVPRGRGLPHTVIQAQKSVF